MILRYKGDGPYVDPAGRFVAQQGDLVDLSDEEAETLLRTAAWEVMPDGAKRKGRGGVPANDGGGGGLR